MSVVSVVGAGADDEREPTWDEAMAEFNAATPVELSRSPRSITVVYRYTDGVFTATSPDVRSFRVTGRTLREAKAAARQDLERFLDPAVRVVERDPVPDSMICTAAVAGILLKTGSLPGLVVVPSSSGATGTVVSSARTSRRRTRVA